MKRQTIGANPIPLKAATKQPESQNEKKEIFKNMRFLSFKIYSQVVMTLRISQQRQKISPIQKIRGRK